jgi:nucleoid DNA-binding protein
MNIPNKKAPRIRNGSLRIMDITRLRKFIKLHPEYKGMTIREFGSVIKAFNQEILNDLIENRDGVVLPENLGHLQIKNVKYRNAKLIDYGKSIKHNKVLHFKNWDTDGTFAKVIYKSHYRNRFIKFYRFWTFKLARPASQQVSKSYKDMYSIYESLNISVK